MSSALRLDLKQTQGLVMTPQLQQAIKLLQLSNLELQTYVEGELEQNPFLERAEEATERPPADGPERSDAPELDGRPALAAAEPGDGWSGDADEGWAPPAAAGLPEGLGVNEFASVGRGGSTDFGGDDATFDDRLSRPATLRDHLLEQLTLDLHDPVARLIGADLIDQVDEAGYLRGDVVEIADRLGLEVDAVRAVLARLQQFDPPGVLARSIGECLALQLRERGRLDPAMERLIDNLPMVAQADIQGLIRVCGVLPDDLPEMLAELKALNPKPGLAFAAGHPDTV
ncbi:MAG TPA: RNA polymerase sigma-54 factor, partial [Geminicoccaceae bacterium]